MKVNIITLTIALFVTENSAIHLQNFLSDEVVADETNLQTADNKTSAKLDDVKNTSLKLKVGKIEHDETITPKTDTHNSKENIDIKNQQFKEIKKEIKEDKKEAAAKVEPLNDTIAKIEASKAEASQKQANEAAKAAEGNDKQGSSDKDKSLLERAMVPVATKDKSKEFNKETSFQPNGEDAQKVGNTNIQKIELKRIGGSNDKKESKCKDKEAPKASTEIKPIQPSEQALKHQNGLESANAALKTQIKPLEPFKTSTPSEIIKPHSGLENKVADTSVIKPHSGMDTVNKALKGFSDAPKAETEKPAQAAANAQPVPLVPFGNISPAKKEESIDGLEKILKNPNGMSFPDNIKDAKSKVQYLENLKKQFEEAQGKIGQMVDTEKEKEEKELNSQFKAFDYNGSPKSREEVLENQSKEKETDKPEKKGVIIKSVPGTHFPNDFRVNKSDYHQGQAKQLAVQVTDKVFENKKKELQDKLQKEKDEKAKLTTQKNELEAKNKKIAADAASKIQKDTEAAAKIKKENELIAAAKKVSDDRAAKDKAIKQQQTSLVQTKKSYESKVKGFNKLLAQFSSTLDGKKFESAIKLQKEIKNGKDFVDQKLSAPEINVNTVQVYKNQFSFPQILKNDYAIEQIDYLQGEQDKLLADPQTVTNFILQSQEVAKNLKTRFKNQWINPNGPNEEPVDQQRLLKAHKKGTNGANQADENLFDDLAGAQSVSQKMAEAQSEVNINEIVEESLKDINNLSQQKEENMTAESKIFQSQEGQKPETVEAVVSAAETPKQALDQAWNNGIEDKVIQEKIGQENEPLKDYEEIVF